MDILTPLALVVGFAAGFILGRMTSKPAGEQGGPSVTPRSDGPPPGEPR